MREKISLNGAKFVHFIGIGGISMSGLAEILKREGFNVSGSDDNSSDITKRLQELGIPVKIPTASENIADGIDMVVYTAAIKKENPEFQAASAKGIPLVERAAFIGMILPGYENAICIAGTHGKTTTTSMVAEITMEAKLDPTISIGGHMNRGGMNYRIGDSSYFVLEACEYSNSFHHWHPRIGIILNIDADHLDFFGNMENIIQSFKKFASNIRPGGTLIIGSDIPQFETITNGLNCQIIAFGQNVKSRFWPKNVKYTHGKPSFDVMDGEKFLAHVDLPMPGTYNMLNALAAFATGCALGIPPETTANALNNVKGIKRRYEHKGMYNGIEIIDDYSHHPTEIRSCLAAAKTTMADRKGKIVCIFQPHTYTRTKNFFNDFADSFTDADKIVLLPIYAAREPHDLTISSKMLSDEIEGRGGDAKSVENFDEAGKFLHKILNPGDLLITMGAGDVYKVGESLLSV